MPERIDSLEKTPEGMTFLAAMAAKLMYDSSDEDDDDDDDDDEMEDASIQKSSLKICKKTERQSKSTKKIVRESLLSSGEKRTIEKDG